MKFPKFKVWDKKLKKFINYNSFLSFDNKEYSFLQFLGVYDKNGKELCVGDIVSFQYKDEGIFTGKIYFDDMYLGFSVQDSKAFYGSMQLSYYNSKDFEIIGNVYENPELLK